MFKLLGLRDRVGYALLLSAVMLTGCQPDPKEGSAVEKPVDDSSGMTEINQAEVTTVEEGIDNNEIDTKTKSDDKVESSSDKVDLERRTSAIVKKEPATKKESATTKSVEVSLENDRAKPENLFDYANSDKYAEGYRETIYPKSGKEPTFAGYPVVAFDTLYFEEWVGCCPSTTNEFMLANVSSGNRQKLEAYANKNECEVRDLPSEDIKHTYDWEGRDLPLADNYIELSCMMTDEH